MTLKMFRNVLLLWVACALTFLTLARGGVRVWAYLPIAAGTLGLVSLILWGDMKSSVGRREKIDILMIGYLVVMLASTIVSQYRYSSIVSCMSWVGYGCLYYCIVRYAGRDVRRNILRVSICLGSVLSAYGLLQYAGLFSHDWWRPGNFLAASYVNHNHFSGYLELVLPVAVGMLINRREASYWFKGILIAGITLMVIAFIFAQSRGAWLSLICAILFMVIIFLQRGHLNRIGVAAIIGILIVSACVALNLDSRALHQRVESIGQVARGEASLTTRYQIWQGTLAMIRDRPIVGTGPGTFKWMFGRYRPEGLNARANFAHNDYLHAAAEMGVMAPFLMIVIIVLLIHRSIMTGHPVVIGCGIGIMSLALHGLVDFNFHIPSNMLLFTIYAAIVRATVLPDKEMTDAS